MGTLKVYYAKHFKGNKLIPAYSGDAGMDLYYSGEEQTKILNPGEIYELKTGIHIAVPVGHFGMVLEKSGLGKKFGTTLHGRVIDEGYRGEVIILMSVLKTKTFEWGSKIAQLVIVPYMHYQRDESPLVKNGAPQPTDEVFILEDLGSTERGDKGFGSSGA